MTKRLYVLTVATLLLLVPTIAIRSLGLAAILDAPNDDITIHYGNAASAGYGFRDSDTGVTIVTMPAKSALHTEIVLSMATSITDERSVKDFKIVAKTRNGRELNPAEPQGVSGSGIHHKVITFICKFPARGEDIENIVIHPVAK
ncbi:MAG: hypothetical protein NTW52_00425 [Planctomycetota bacterium]|nr:hypothetical protein [Planctomycetota bacterium]